MYILVVWTGCLWSCQAFFLPPTDDGDDGQAFFLPPTDDGDDGQSRSSRPGKHVANNEHSLIMFDHLSTISIICHTLEVFAFILLTLFWFNALLHIYYIFCYNS